MDLSACKNNGWVSSIDHFPDAEEEVQLCCVTSAGSRYQCHGFYIPPGTYRDDSGYSWDWECCEEYDEARDDYLVNPGWYECIHNWDEYSAIGIVDKVTHWRPLCEMPNQDQLGSSDGIADIPSIVKRGQSWIMDRFIKEE